MSFRNDVARMGEQQRLGAAVGSQDGFRWRCDSRVEKYHGGIADVQAGKIEPYDVLDIPGNLLLIGGADVIWLGMKALLTATTGQKNTYFNNANAALLIGNSVTAAASSQTDLQASSGASNRWVQGMDATFPTHTTGATASTTTKILFKATVSSANGNFAWAEWGVGNKVSQAKAYPGRLLNRKVQALGTKTSAGVWALTVTLSLA